MDVETLKKLGGKKLMEALDTLKANIAAYVAVRCPDLDDEDRAAITEFGYAVAVGTIEKDAESY